MACRIVAGLVVLLLSTGGDARATTPETLEAAGLARAKSAHSVVETLDRAEAALTQRGLKLFGRVDHARAAEEVGLSLPPTVVFVFGNPKMGTPAMAKQPLSAIDFPLKGLVYQDAEGHVWLAFNTAEYVFGTIFPRHELEAPADAAERYRALLEAVAREATE